jgi:hypothetical protein
MIAQTVTTKPAARPVQTVPQRMADFIIRHTAAADGVTRDDLLGKFTSQQIDEHFAAARRLADKARADRPQ